MTNTPPPVISHKIGVRLFEQPAAKGRENSRILLIKLDHIGDFIAAIDAFRLIRQAFLNSEITLICLPSIVGLAQSTGLFDRVIGFLGNFDSPLLGKVPKMDVEDQIAKFTDLLEGHYHLAADFRHDGETRHWLDHVDAQYRAGFKGPTCRGLDIVLPDMEWEIPVTDIAKKNLSLHATTRLTLLAHAVIDSLQETPLEPELFALSETDAAGPVYQALKNSDRFKIGICVGAGSELKKWAIDYWVDLIKHVMQTHNALFVFFGGKGDKEETQAIMAQLPPESCLDLTATLPLAQLPAFMSLLNAYIGCDTGLTHMAAKLGLPTVNIFAGTGAPSVWRVRGPKVKTVYAEVKCAPCHLRFKEECPNSNICMTAIMPGMVSACLEQLIAPEVYT